MSIADYSTPPAVLTPEGRGNWMSWLAKLAPLLGLAVVVALFSALRPARFPTVPNIEIMLVQTAVVATAALGMTLIIISGGIDLSVGSNIAFCTVVIALLLKAGVSPLLAAAGGAACGALVGLFIGSLVTALRMAPFIVTLGMWSSLRGIAKELADSNIVSPDRSTWLNDLLTVPYFPFPARWPAWGPWKALQIAWEMPPGVWLTVFLALLMAGLLRYTKLGRHVFAIGSNEQTARLCGINVPRTKIAVYTLGALFVGIAGVLQFSYLTLGDPTTAGGMELNIIAAVVVGGASLTGGEGTVFGSILGALIMTAVANGCQKMGFGNPVQEIVTGGIIILAVALDRLRHRKSS